MKKFHAVAHGGIAPDRRFSVTTDNMTKAIALARQESADAGFPQVFVENEQGCKIYEGETTGCQIFFSDEDPDGEPCRDPSGGWYYQLPGTASSNGPYATQSQAIREAARA